MCTLFRELRFKIERDTKDKVPDGAHASFHPLVLIMDAGLHLLEVRPQDTFYFESVTFLVRERPS